MPEHSDVNLILELFYSTINEIINTHVPLKKLSKKESRLYAKPWITKGLPVSIANKNKLYKSYLKSRNSYYLSKFKSYRNKLKHLILINKKSYYSSYFLRNKDNIKGVWKGIK